MSYVEKSVYKYIKNIVISGFKALFTKKFLIYTIFFLITMITTTLTALVVIPSVNLAIFGIPPEQMINYIFYFEIAFSISYILVGFLLSKTPIYLHVPLIIVFTGGITTGFYFLDRLTIITIISAVLFCIWMGITVISTFSFSRNLFGSKVTGSILFMGKKEGGSALFSKILTPLIIGCIGLNGYILYQGIVQKSIIYLTTASVGIAMGLFVLVIIWRLARKDDVFYTILPFFYLVANTHTIQLVIRLLRGDTTYLAWTNIIISAFFLLNSISRYYRKVKKLDLDFTPKKDIVVANEELEEPEQEEFYISDVLRFISDRGVIMLILGFALAYHSMILQIGFNRSSITTIFAKIPEGIVQSAHCVTIIFAAVIVIISIILYNRSKKFRFYSSPAIFRLSFLPEYDELERFIIDAKSGNINWKIFARDTTIKLAKKGGSATARLGISIKDQSVEFAKKSFDKVKGKASTLVDKAKNWRQNQKEEYTEEDDDF